MTRTLPARFNLFRDQLLLQLFLVIVLAAPAAGQAPRSQELCRSPSPQMLQKSQHYLENTPCAPVTAACNKGGYLLGCADIKKGIVWECMGPLFGGKAVPGVEMLPTDPDVATCKQFCGPGFEKAEGPCKQRYGH